MSELGDWLRKEAEGQGEVGIFARAALIVLDLGAMMEADELRHADQTGYLLECLVDAAMQEECEE